MKSDVLKVVLVLMTITSMTAYGTTVAHWDFADAGAGNDVTMPGNGERADLDSSGAMGMEDFRVSSTDLSGNGNDLTAWTSDWMEWDSDSVLGDYSMRATDNWGNHWPDARTDSTYNPTIQDPGYTGIDAETITPAQWTIEAVINVTGANWDNNNQTFVGRDGRNTGGVSSNAATLYFSIRGADLAIDYRDVTGVSHILQVSYAVNYGTWYHMAAVSDGTWLRLYVDGVEIGGGLDMTGTSVDTALGLGDTGQWTVACGQWAGGAVDRFNGLVDEVALSDVALAPGSFVVPIPEPATMVLLGLGALVLRRKK